MTAAQTSIPLKGSISMSGILAAVLAGLMVAVVIVAISARPVAAPATTSVQNPTRVLTLGHDEARFAVPVLTSGHDESRPNYVQSQPRKHVPGFQVKPAVPSTPITPQAPRFGGAARPQ